MHKTMRYVNLNSPIYPAMSPADNPMDAPIATSIIFSVSRCHSVEEGSSWDVHAQQRVHWGDENDSEGIIQLGTIRLKDGESEWIDTDDYGDEHPMSANLRNVAIVLFQTGYITVEEI